MANPFYKYARCCGPPWTSSTAANARSRSAHRRSSWASCEVASLTVSQEMPRVLSRDSSHCRVAYRWALHQKPSGRRVALFVACRPNTIQHR